MCIYIYTIILLLNVYVQIFQFNVRKTWWGSCEIWWNTTLEDIGSVAQSAARAEFLETYVPLLL